MKRLLMLTMLLATLLGSATLPARTPVRPKMTHVLCNFWFEGQFYFGCHHVEYGTDGSLVEILD